MNTLRSSYVRDQETTIPTEKIRRRAFSVEEHARPRVKIKDILTYERTKLTTEHGLFVESYLRVIKSLDRKIKQN